jgi:GNAT superfamily N-acetyltransferase
MEITIAKTPEQADKAWEAISLLRPHLQKEQFKLLMQEMFAGGYQLAYIEEDNKAVSVIGYRHLQFLFNGRHIYIDDLSTLEAYRGKGYAGKLVDFVVQLAREKQYEVVTLDSGYHRHDAHRLYMNKGFVIQGYHFSKKI